MRKEITEVTFKPTLGLESVLSKLERYLSLCITLNGQRRNRNKVLRCGGKAEREIHWAWTQLLKQRELLVTSG